MRVYEPEIMASYRAGASEQERTDSLLEMTPAIGAQMLDIGARDGHFATLLAERFSKVIALDLKMPDIRIENVECVQGDVTDLAYDDEAFQFVLCAEVLEHIPPAKLGKACSELARVCSEKLLIGVPYRQDLRINQLTCGQCGRTTPAWGHLNTFDRAKLESLFPDFKVERAALIGKNTEATNFLAVWLMNIALNPFGTYKQEEPCMHCGARLQAPKQRGLLRRVAGKCGFHIQKMSHFVARPHANWLHVLFVRRDV